MNKNEYNHLLVHFWLINSALLTVAVGRSEYYRIKYLQAIEREPTFERVRVFFKRIQPLLKMVYPIVDGSNKKRGRPAIDRRFQLRFIIWWKMFEPPQQKTAIDRFNDSPILREILASPIEKYSRSTMRRSLKQLGEKNLRKITVTIIKNMIITGRMTINSLAIDSLPMYSCLSKKTCLSMECFDKELVKKFFQQLNLSKIVILFS